MEPSTEIQPRRGRTMRRTMAAAVLAGLLLVACGDDDDSTASTGTDAEQTRPADGDVVEVELVDFEFENLPESVPAGTKFTVVNTSKGELHELVAMKLDDGEKRSAEEIASLPPEELGKMFAGEPAMVLLAAPGGDVIPAVGDGTLSEPGRYFVVCMIPTGVDPAEYLEAAQNSNGGPPQIEGAGIPHIAHGMFAEIVVES